MKTWLSAAALAAIIAAPMAANANYSAEEASAKIAEQYGVEVLRTQTEWTSQGKSYLLTVMRPEGLRNGAMGVHRLRVKASTGDLMLAFRHNQSGYELPGAASKVPNKHGPEAARRASPWR